MRERFALLEPQMRHRSERAQRFGEIFSARSAIAHGGGSSVAAESGFARSVAADVVWTTYRMLSFDRRFVPTTEKDIEEAFEQLRWGTAVWSGGPTDDFAETAYIR